MDLKFELGDPVRPCGHAIIYFTDPADPEKSSATYIILLPVTVDIKKYVPPFLAGQIEGMSSADMSAFAFPPAPEAVESASWVRSVAEARGDDLIYGGRGSANDAPALMGRVSEIMTEYRQLYAARRIGAAPNSGGRSEEPAAPVEDVVYSLMSEADLLTELTTLTGRLRYAVEGGDRATAAETEARIRAIGYRVPENRRISRLAEVASNPSPKSSALAQLYVERAYALFREDYLRVKTLEKQIADLEAEHGRATG
jgi:hypothetical protein